MKKLLLALLTLLPLAAQPPTLIIPGSPPVSATINTNFSGLYSGRVGRWNGAGVPGSFPYSVIGDQYYDTTSLTNSYTCWKTGCTTVGAGNWVLNSTSSSSAFSAITTGSNLTAAMTVGSGASLGFAGTGTIDASKLMGVVMSSLTGPIKTTAGVPSVLVASDIYGLFSGTHDSTHCTAGDGTMVPCSGGSGGSPNPSAQTCNTSISTTVLTGETSAGSTTPCSYEINDTIYKFLVPVTVTISVAPTLNGAYTFYINTSGQPEMQLSSGIGGTFTGSSVNVVSVSSPTFPVGSRPKAHGSVTANSTSWTSVVDDRPTGGSGTYLSASTGIATITNGVIGIDTAVVPQKGGTNIWTGINDFSTAARTAPAQVGTTVPSTCSVGDVFFKSNATAGQNLYECQSTNVFTQQLNSGGASVDPTLIQYATVALTSNQIKNLGTTAITLVAAPGANKYVEVISVSVVYLYGTATYTGGGNVFVLYGNGQNTVMYPTGGVPSTQFTATSSQVYGLPFTQPAFTTVANMANQSVIFQQLGGTAFATGDGTAYVHISYRTVPSNG